MTYEEMREKRKSKLLYQFTEAIDSDNMRKAYLVLKKTMAYRFLPLDSEVVSKKALKDLEDLAGAHKKTDIYDYRNSDAKDVLPENILFNNMLSGELEVVSKEHWGKRRELSYQGDYILPEKNLKYFIRLKYTEQTARAAISGIEDMYKRLSKLELKNDWREGVKTGKNKIYAIEIDNQSSYKIRILGYVNIGFSANGKPIVRVLLDNAEMEKQYIDIKDTYRNIHEIFIKWYCDKCKMYRVDIALEPLCDVEKIGSRQRSNQRPVLTMEEHVIIKNEALAKMTKEELEKETDWN